MIKEEDLKQIKNLINSFIKKKGYYPFVEDLENEYKLFFPQNLTKEEKDKIEDFITKIIEEDLEKKETKGAKIMKQILDRNKKLWKNFRKLNSKRYFNETEFQKLGKEVENLMEQGESKLVEKLVGGRSIGIGKASDAWYNMIYAIFPEWNKIK